MNLIPELNTIFFKFNLDFQKRLPFPSPHLVKYFIFYFLNFLDMKRKIANIQQSVSRK